MIFPIASLLQCPNCHEPLTINESALKCANHHSFDIARQNYVNFLSASKTGVRGGDTLAMVEARTNHLEGGAYEPIAEAILQEFRSTVLPATEGPIKFLDLGAGTGYYSNYVIEHGSFGHGALAIAADSSSYAVRRAAQISPSIGALLMDSWKAFPIQDCVMDACLIVFAPRNSSEISRILQPLGRLIVVTPAQDHLQEIVSEFRTLSVDEAKDARLGDQLGADFRRLSRTAVHYQLQLDSAAVRALVLMGPSAHHLEPAVLDAQIARTHDRQVTVSVNVDNYAKIT